MPPPTGDRPHEQDLIEAELPLRRRAFAQTEALLEVGRRPGGAVKDPGAEAGSEGFDRGGYALGQRIHPRRVILVQIASVRINGMLTIAHATEEFAAGTICGAKFQPATDADQRKLKEAIAKLGW